MHTHVQVNTNHEQLVINVQRLKAKVKRSHLHYTTAAAAYISLTLGLDNHARVFLK